MMLLSPTVRGGTEFADNLEDLSKVRVRPAPATIPEPAGLWPTPDSVDEFMSGGCGVFALVLNYYTGWPVVYFLCDAKDCGRNPESKLKLGHVTVVDPKRGMIVDSYGHRPKPMMIKNFGVGLTGPMPANRQALLRDLREGSRIGPYGEETFDHARDLILKHWGLYGYRWNYPADISAIRKSNVMGRDEP